MWTATGPWLLRGECMDDKCLHMAQRHRHRIHFCDEDDRVIVADPALGPTPGRVTHRVDDKVYIEGPRIPGDSRSMHWTIPEHLVPRYVSLEGER